MVMTLPLDKQVNETTEWNLRLSSRFDPKEARPAELVKIVSHWFSKYARN